MREEARGALGEALLWACFGDILASIVAARLRTPALEASLDPWVA